MLYSQGPMNPSPIQTNTLRKSRIRQPLGRTILSQPLPSMTPQAAISGLHLKCAESYLMTAKLASGPYLSKHSLRSPTLQTISPSKWHTRKEGGLSARYEQGERPPYDVSYCVTVSSKDLKKHRSRGIRQIYISTNRTR